MKKRPLHGYTEAFKMQVVREVENGRITKSQASERYGILGHSTVLKWCRKYGECVSTKASKGPVMSEKDIEIQRQANEIKALKEELDAARLKNAVYDTLIDVAERELKISIRKKFGARQSGKQGSVN